MKRVVFILLALAGAISMSAQTTTADENMAAVKKFMEVQNKTDWMDHTGFLFTPEGFEMYKKMHAGFREVFPDYNFETKMISAKGDSVLVFGLVSGTHSKTWDLFPDIPATNKKIYWFETLVLILKDGKSIGGFILNDRLNMMNQLGYGCKPERITP
jgi:predicted ester cyclase